MTKAELCQLFPALSPRRAIRKLNDRRGNGYEVVGKWVRVEKVGNSWEVFLCNVRDMTKGMGTKRLNNLIALVPPVDWLQVGDGEAWGQTKDVNLVRAWLEENRVALGITKRVEVSDAEREARSCRMKSVKMPPSRDNLPEAVPQAAPARAHEAYGPPTGSSPQHAPGAPMASLP